MLSTQAAPLPHTGVAHVLINTLNTTVRAALETRRKVKHRATREFLIGGVLGPITRPEVAIAGLYRPPAGPELGDHLAVLAVPLPARHDTATIPAPTISS